MRATACAIACGAPQSYAEYLFKSTVMQVDFNKIEGCLRIHH